MSEDIPLPAWALVFCCFMGLVGIVKQIDEKLDALKRSSDEKLDALKSSIESLYEDNDSEDESDSRVEEKVADAKRLSLRQREMFGKNKF
jgi:hypothetical protein